MIREFSPQFGSTKLVHVLRGIAASALGVALLLGSVIPVQADELDERRDELTSSIADQADAVAHASGELTTANAALGAALDELGVAQAKLEAAEKARRDAQVLDDERAVELAAAEYAVKQAEADVNAARAALDSVEARTNEEIVVITQQHGPLLQLALLVTDVSAAELNQRAQLSTTLFDSSALQLDELESRRLALDAAMGRADEARATATTARQAAADQLSDSVKKEATADALRTDVELKVVARDAAADEAANQLASEQVRQENLAAESLDVDRRIAERIAAQQAAEEAARVEAARIEAARVQAAATQAAEDAAAKKAADARAAAEAAKDTSPSVSQQQVATPKPQQVVKPQPPRVPAASSGSSSGFQRPVAGRLSSAYGMRLHPVLGKRKLHDGTDFAAACGTPMKAAASGTVAERYYNAGYGNRLMIDHGKLDGRYVTTGYNHATSYIVSVGQKVSKGQTIGYVGTTGYSTGCHLHLMVWENGGTVNPMSKWFS